MRQQKTPAQGKSSGMNKSAFSTVHEGNKFSQSKASLRLKKKQSHKPSVLEPHHDLSVSELQFCCQLQSLFLTEEGLLYESLLQLALLLWRKDGSWHARLPTLDLLMKQISQKYMCHCSHGFRRMQWLYICAPFAFVRSKLLSWKWQLKSHTAIAGGSYHNSRDTQKCEEKKEKQCHQFLWLITFVDWEKESRKPEWPAKFWLTCFCLSPLLSGDEKVVLFVFVPSLFSRASGSKRRHPFSRNSHEKAKLVIDKKKVLHIEKKLTSSIGWKSRHDSEVFCCIGQNLFLFQAFVCATCSFGRTKWNEEENDTTPQFLYDFTFTKGHFLRFALLFDQIIKFTRF